MTSRSINLNDRYQRPYGMPRPAPTAVTSAMDRAPAAKPRRHRSRAGSRPNAALEALYRKRLERLVTEMGESVLYWTKAAYRKHEPVMAQDKGNGKNRLGNGRVSSVAYDSGCRSDMGSSPGGGRIVAVAQDESEVQNERHSRDGNGNDNRGSDDDCSIVFDARPPTAFLKAAFDRLRKRWEERFDDAAGKLARWFTQSAATRSDERLRRILKDGGLSVRFTPTKAMRDVMEGTVQANVALIKSIPEKYLTQVEGIVYRSVQTGRDLHQLSNDLRRELGVTKRRAATIALNQNNAATSAMTRARQVELGVQSVWVHSHAGKEPRPTHLANDGQPYDPAVGWFDTDPKVRRRIWPGELINCRCFARSVIKGFKP